jgi:hypothetical protein
MEKRIDPNTLFTDLGRLMSHCSYDEAETAIVAHLETFRYELTQNRTSYNDQELNHLYAIAIFLRACLDYEAIDRILSTPNWESNNELIENVWTLLWDCKERIESYPGAVTGPKVDEMHRFIEDLLARFQENFGPGVYMSPDVKVKTRECSICNSNIKLCSHVPGKLYAGHICRQIMHGLELISVSAVSKPEDRRCRIWPWNYDEQKGTAKAVFLTFFLIDDFLHEKDWHTMFKRISALSPKNAYTVRE